MRSRTRGFTLYEVLIAVLILAIGILGVTGLQVLSLQQNRSALLRAQALQVGNDILDRIRANPDGTYNGIDFDDDPSGSTNCIGPLADCSEDDMATYDIAQWKCSINPLDENGDVYSTCTTLGVTPGTANSLPEGQGAISINGDGVHEISVRWSDYANPNSPQTTITLRSRAN
ncbi:MAG: type IV pilus modification protein PilV [Pseudomonadota bacterium]